MRGVDYIRATAFTAAALSTMCVEVNSMKSVPLEFAIGTNWIHFAALLAVFSVDPEPTGVVIEQDLLAVRRSNATRWFTNFGNQYKSGLTLISMVSDGRSFGLREELYTFFRDKRYAANLIDILTLAWPLTTQDRRSLFRESRAHFGHRIRFRLIDGPLLCSPNWVKAFASGTISLTGRAKRALMKKS